MQQQQQHQPQHQQPQQKLDRRSAGLEELIMGCTSSTSAKGVSAFQFSINRLNTEYDCSKHDLLGLMMSPVDLSKIS